MTNEIKLLEIIEGIIRALQIVRSQTTDWMIIASIDTITKETTKALQKIRSQYD